MRSEFFVAGFADAQHHPEITLYDAKVARWHKTESAHRFTTTTAAIGEPLEVQTINKQKSYVRLAGGVSPGSALLLEQLPFPFFQKTVDFYD